VLRVTRRLRWIGLVGTAFPVALVALLVLLNRLTSGGMRFLVNGDPWTHTFWSGLFYIWAGGLAFLLLTVARRCPRCGEGFFARAGYSPRRLGTDHTPGARFNINVFSSHCVNCGLGSDGRNW